mmetsp:Transcript_2747/g.6239  ORF Transcript_2747/g.6239 Transcript_2747/m.6239 type:complete len:289 (-) Transcript_2747:580-1446(-)
MIRTLGPSTCAMTVMLWGDACRMSHPIETTSGATTLGRISTLIVFSSCGPSVSLSGTTRTAWYSNSGYRSHESSVGAPESFLTLTVRVYVFPTERRSATIRICGSMITRTSDPKPRRSTRATSSSRYACPAAPKPGVRSSAGREASLCAAWSGAGRWCTISRAVAWYSTEPVGEKVMSRERVPDGSMFPSAGETENTLCVTPTFPWRLRYSSFSVCGVSSCTTSQWYAIPRGVRFLSTSVFLDEAPGAIGWKARAVEGRSASERGRGIGRVSIEQSWRDGMSACPRTE